MAKKTSNLWQIILTVGLLSIFILPNLSTASETVHFSFDDGVGSATAYDSSGNSNDGTIYGATIDPEGLYRVAGPVLHFNGTPSDYVVVPSQAMNGLTDLSVEFWAHHSPPAESWKETGCIISAAVGDEPSLVKEFILKSVSHSPNQSELAVSVKDAVWFTGVSLLENWKYVVVTRTNSEVRVYVNGVLQAETTSGSDWYNFDNASPTPPTGSVEVAEGGLIIGQEQDSVGGGFGDGTQSYAGQLDEIAIYNHALTAAEVEQKYQEYTALRVPERYGSIQEAIDAADDGDTVLVYDGIYVENINFNGKAVTVKSVNGAAATIIDGNQSGSVVIFNSGEGSASLLDGFTITNGSASYGGGIYCASSSPTITNCTISDNLARAAGGIFCYNASPTITDCIISGNSASENIDPMHINSGGGIACSNASAPTITNCTISGNTAINEGGGIYCEINSSPTITNCTISDNSANYSGGGIYCDGSSPVIKDCVIKNNSAMWGGGVHCDKFSSPTISNCTISYNSAESRGGGIYCLSSSAPTIEGCNISNNSVDLTGEGKGGGISCNWSASPTISNCTISGNSAKNGGGIHCEGNCLPTITNCIISNNQAIQWGGGITCLSTSPVITSCTIINNTSDSQGGGLFLFSASPIMNNCIISGNLANYGGGINCWYSSPTITNCTIGGNSASDESGDIGHGGGIACYNSSPIVLNSILWGNNAAESTNEISLQQSSSINITYSDIEGGWTGEGNIDADPSFVNPDNGNYYLQYGSPCVDAGTLLGAPSDDIDGNSRPQGAGYDMGAYEQYPLGDVDADGDIDIDDVFCLFRHIMGRSSCLDNKNRSAADVDANGDVDIDDVFCLFKKIMGRPSCLDGVDVVFGSSTTTCLDMDNDGYYYYDTADCGTARDYYDLNSNINPGATEICDGLDNNCDGNIDEGVTNTYYPDADGDDYGDLNLDNAIQACSVPEGYVTDNTDCNDNDAGINPSACDIKKDGIDQDCDGRDRKKGKPCR